jgi:hypothetical protein
MANLGNAYLIFVYLADRHLWLSGVISLSGVPLGHMHGRHKPGHPPPTPSESGHGMTGDRALGVKYAMWGVVRRVELLALVTRITWQ